MLQKLNQTYFFKTAHRQKGLNGILIKATLEGEDKEIK